MNTGHPREEQAIAYALGLMDEAERIAFEPLLKTDSALRALVDELQTTAAAMAYETPQHLPPADVQAAVLASTKHMAQERPSTIVPTSSSRSPLVWLGWAAAIIGIASIYSWKQTESTQLQAENRALKEELTRLSRANNTAQLQIASLKSTVAEYQQGVAVVVWNSEKQEGVLRLEKMPPVATGKDYQLWVVDPKHKTPVNAGIVRVDETGFAKVDFKPTLNIDEAKNFAISVEAEGGVPENKGPIVLLSP
jgi:anti-sigma-K factor RskA